MSRSMLESLGTLGAVLTRTNLRATIAVSIALVAAFIFTGFLSSWYGRARVSRGLQYYQIGRELQAAGDVEGAAEQYRKALLFNPDEVDYRLSLAVALVELGQLDEAQSHLEELLEDEPTSGVVNLMLARVAERRGRVQQAIQFYQRAVYGYWPPNKLATRHAARWDLVGLLERQNRRNELVGELLQLEATSSGDAKERSKIGFLLLQYDATSDATNLFRDLVKDHPRFVEAHHGLGQSYFDSGDYAAARREFQKAIHVDPNDHENVHLLSLTNAVLNLDPSLPRLNLGERLARSRRLLDRVIHDLNDCTTKNGGANDAQKQRLDDAQKLAVSTSNDADSLALQLQDAAQQLWKERYTFCTKNAPVDNALITVLEKIAQ
jgi:tetratricopeptide (TPR) repeat protein